ncbi:hypothetical protein FH972_025337 [Carpinus fangiana]|uniref:Uncharacterized protein n=1 Tax=Carpinus fangiana TaxID=176857 RepID=A0A5N6L1C0_9ROSI|nr:hypothetical protein FH972_025337 [Carpinus fangiana]
MTVRVTKGYIFGHRQRQGTLSLIEAAGELAKKPLGSVWFRGVTDVIAGKRIRRQDKGARRSASIAGRKGLGLRRGTKGSRCEEGSLKELFKQSWYPSMRSAECSACPIGERKESPVYPSVRMQHLQEQKSIGSQLKTASIQIPMKGNRDLPNGPVESQFKTGQDQLFAVKADNSPLRRVLEPMSHLKWRNCFLAHETKNLRLHYLLRLT